MQFIALDHTVDIGDSNIVFTTGFHIDTVLVTVDGSLSYGVHALLYAIKYHFLIPDSQCLNRAWDRTSYSLFVDIVEAVCDFYCNAAGRTACNGFECVQIPVCGIVGCIRALVFVAWNIVSKCVVYILTSPTGYRQLLASFKHLYFPLRVIVEYVDQYDIVFQSREILSS